MSALVAFALASTLHAGFQLTVTVLVYPALATRRLDEWALEHSRHSRRIVPLVVLVYAALVVSGVALVVSSPPALGWVALAGALAALGTTAAVAAPLHGRLDRRSGVLVRRLLVADRWRCIAAVVGAVAAVAAVAVG